MSKSLSLITHHLSLITEYLPLVVRERLVGLGHTVRVVLLLDGIAAVVGGVEHLAGEAVDHRLLAAGAGGAHDPADGERAAALLRDLDGHLVGRAADAARLDLDGRAHVLDGALEHLQGVFAGLLADLRQRPVEDALGRRLLAAPHQAVDELRHQRAVVNRVGEHVASVNNSSSRHSRFSVWSYFLPLAPPLAAPAAAPPFGRLAPYFERPCLRSLTPTESSVPRMMW